MGPSRVKLQLSDVELGYCLLIVNEGLTCCLSLSALMSTVQFASHILQGRGLGFLRFRGLWFKVQGC